MHSCGAQSGAIWERAGHLNLRIVDQIAFFGIHLGRGHEATGAIGIYQDEGQPSAAAPSGSQLNET